MVTVNYVGFVVLLFTQGSVAIAQEAPAVVSSEPPQINVPNDYGSSGASNFGQQNEDYLKQYDDNQYGGYGKNDEDNVKQYDDYQYGDYGKDNEDYVKQYDEYQYGDYGSGYEYGNYENGWQYEDYGYYGDQHYDEYYGYGDRNYPLDAATNGHGDTALAPDNQTPWVYIIVPVVQIDVFYIDDKDKAIEDIELQLPIQTFLFELGDFGMAHLGTLGFGGDFGMSADYGYGADYGQYDYPYYDQKPDYGKYDYGAKADLFDTADQLADMATLDYPGLDHDNSWIDWIFMMPPNDFIPQAFL